MQTQNYVSVLIESLQKKVVVLEQIIEKNKLQRLILMEEDVDGDLFEENMNEKSDLIDELNQLDDGFELVYERVKAAFEKGKEEYKEQIQTMQQLIRQITEKSTTIQIQEQKNRELAERKFSDSKKKIREVTSSRQVADKYHQNMGKSVYLEPQFMDSKK